ncbi:ATP-binding protein [Bradyrhizobium lablabi]|uniref:ATP-binding protein n=1 Tax=Bradyrhizobium lablabi TaxID=722472 RepID=UPI00090A62FC|nr:ATP-binding protein [Bradyrhizobium lablabi]SHM18717.1 Histidine kinase-, DNA gyrase B-, and HSP90-like ATPase [Bradyrhizobium lablabi]
MAEEHISVAVQDDFVERQITRAKPIQALAELIWNGLDADATSVDIELKRNDLAGELSQIIVYDNGDGFSRDEAKALFGNLGGSWKRTTRETARLKRQIHGQEGRGRYRAFALGRAVEWDVCYKAANGNRSFKIRLFHGQLNDVTITDENTTPKRPTGVIVTISDLWHDYRLLESEDRIQELIETFALYLMNYRGVNISIAGTKLDPDAAILSQNTRQIAVFPEQAGAHAVELHIVEWKKPTKRTLYLCTSNGFPVDQLETRFQVPQPYSFSAYLKSTFVDVMQTEGRVGLAELDPAIIPLIESAREAIRDYFQNRSAERARTIVDDWKARNIYPYQGAPQGSVETAERQVFDMVAVRIQEIAPDIGSSSEKDKAFHLRMLRSAIERGPDELQTIMKEVLDLPPREQKALADLLQETTLSAMITATKTITDRLKFISGLEAIIFNPEMKKRLKERSQLHKILAENTWIFGEEYNLWVNDRSLHAILEKHKQHLDPEIVIDDDVKIIDKTRGIVDLMFSRTTRRHRADDIENLVVELKAPKVKIGSDELTQAKKYAFAIADDERFNTVTGIKWHFWIVSNDYDQFTKREIDGVDRKNRLVYRHDNITVGIKTWAELIEENKARLQFFRDHLQHNADDSAALRFLQEKHSKFLEGVIIKDDDATDEKKTA